LTWVKELTGLPELSGVGSTVSHDEFYQFLRDGMVLCKLMDAIQSGSVNWNDKTFQVPKIEAMKIARERERIAKFNNWVVKYGISDMYTFPTESVHEKGALNLSQVCVCLRNLGIETQSRGVGPEDFWPKKAEKNVRSFTDEQMKAGQNVIGLQMGSNKGASQAGTKSFGRRHIVD